LHWSLNNATCNWAICHCSILLSSPCTLSLHFLPD
jgi:hypothetical protein